MTLYIFRGLPGSGKTTEARKLQQAGGGSLVGRDHIRDLLFGARGQKLEYSQENRVTAVQDELIREGLRNFGYAYVDDLNLRPKYVRRLIEIADAEGHSWTISDMTDVPVEKCIVRDLERKESGGHSVGASVILDLYQRFIKGKGYPLPVPPAPARALNLRPYTPRKFNRPAIIVDLDGTLAIKHESRDIYDGSLAGLDYVDPVVFQSISLYYEAGYSLIFMSGRDDTWYDVTYAWLLGHIGTSDFQLFMRPAGDTRDDAVVKYELFNEHVRDTYRVEVAFDDRDRVVKMWRELGIKTYQVNYGNF